MRPHIETLGRPDQYSRRQLLFAIAIARELDRGTFTLCEKPDPR